MSPKVAGWSSSTRPCLNSSRTARNRTTTSRRSTRELVSARNVIRPRRGSSSTSSSTASATLALMAATWTRSTRGWGAGEPARRPGAQVVGVDAGQQVGGQVEELLLEARRAGVAAGTVAVQAAQHDGGVLEGLALEQPGEEQVALLPEGQLVVEVDVVVLGQEAAGLQLDQGGGDQQELGGDVEVEVLHPLQLGQVGVDDVDQARSRRGRPARAGSGGAAGRRGRRRPMSPPRRSRWCPQPRPRGYGWGDDGTRTLHPRSYRLRR